MPKASFWKIFYQKILKGTTFETFREWKVHFDRKVLESKRMID